MQLLRVNANGKKIENVQVYVGYQTGQVWQYCVGLRVLVCKQITIL